MPWLVISKLKSFSGFIQLIAFHFYFKMSMIFLTALFLLTAQVLLESAAETNTSKAFNWPIRNIFVVPASAYTFLLLIKESSRQMLSEQVLLQPLYNHLAKHGSLWNNLHSLIQCTES